MERSWSPSARSKKTHKRTKGGGGQWQRTKVMTNRILGGESGLMSGLKLSTCRSLPRVREALENDLVFIHWPAQEGSWCARPSPHFHQPQGACNLGNHRSGQPDAGNDSLPVSKGQTQRQQLLGLILPYLFVHLHPAQFIWWSPNP